MVKCILSFVFIQINANYDPLSIKNELKKSAQLNKLCKMKSHILNTFIESNEFYAKRK